MEFFAIKKRGNRTMSTKGILLVRLTSSLTQKQLEVIKKQVGHAADMAGYTAVVTDSSLEAEVHHDTSGLIEAIRLQTAAINALVQSNRELMDYMVGQQADGEQEERQAYMDGTVRD